MGRWAILNGLLGLIVALLGLEIVRTWARVLPPVDPVAKVARAAGPEHHDKGKHADKNGAKAEAAPPILIAEIEQKDLFDPSRQKAPPEAVQAAPPVPKETGPPPGVTVVGFRIFGTDREAFVTDATAQGSQQRRLRTGDQVGGYSVKRIEATGLVLTSPSGDEVTMPLVIEKGKTGAPAPGRPAAPKPGAPGSPAAGVIQGASPSAGIQPPKPPPQPAVQRPQGQVPPVPGAPPVPGVPPAPAAVPPPAPATAPDVRNRLEKLREHQAGSRMGRNKQQQQPH